MPARPRTQWASSISHPGRSLLVGILLGAFLASLACLQQDFRTWTKVDVDHIQRVGWTTPAKLRESQAQPKGADPWTYVQNDSDVKAMVRSLAEAKRLPLTTTVDRNHDYTIRLVLSGQQQYDLNYWKQENILYDPGTGDYYRPSKDFGKRIDPQAG